MTCAELDQRAVDYLYGELGAADRAAVDAHLATCEACQREVRALERTLGVTREALRGPLAHEAPSRVRVALQQEAARAVAQAAARQARSGWSLGEWLRRPWFLPLVASFGVVALFFLAKPAILDKPKQALEAEQAARQEGPGRDEESAGAPTAPGEVPLAEPVMTPPPAGESMLEAVPVGENERGTGERVQPEKKGEGAGVGGVAGPRLMAPTPRTPPPQRKERAKRAPSPAPRPSAVASSGSSRWATPPPAAPPPAAAQPVVAAKSAAKPKDQVLDDDRVARGRAGAAPTTAAAPVGSPGSGGKSANELSRRAPAPAPEEAEPAAIADTASKAEEGDRESDYGVVGVLPLPELRRRADLAYQQARWERAMRDYRELLRRFGGHADAPLWRRRLEISTQAAGR